MDNLIGSLPLPFVVAPCSGPSRILNRFTKDIHFMDDLLPMTLYDFIICSFMVLGGTLIIFFVNPWVVLRSVDHQRIVAAV